MTSTLAQSLKIFIIAGEASGDALGARLIADLRSRAGREVVFSGVGGALMAREGLQSIFSMTDLSVMGVAEVLPRLPLILRRIKETVGAIKREKPDIVITIDSPDFCFRVVRTLKDKGYKDSKFIHYVAPTVWAWRSERAKKIAALYDGLLCLFPFEPPYFECEGLRSAFVGHPVLGYGFESADIDGFKAAHGIAPDKKVLGLLFGSRNGELKRMGGVIRDAAAQVLEKYQNALLLAPTLPHLEGSVRGLLSGLVDESRIIVDPTLKHDAFAAMDGAIATSGTVGLELAVANVPHAIGYKMNALTHQILRRKVRVKYAHLANILLDRSCVPEYIQGVCSVEALSQATEQCLFDDSFREAQREGFTAVRGLIKGQKNAADFILSVLMDKV
jgi:lipid-A-disaccharide synthase